METMDSPCKMQPSAMYSEYDPVRVPDYFPHLSEMRTAYDRRDYVERILVEKALDKSLVVTDLFQQSGDALNECALVILGVSVEEGGMRAGAPVPMELEEYRVRIRAIVGRDGQAKPLHYKSGMKRIGDRFFGKNRHRQPVYQDNLIYPCGPSATEGETSLRHAYMLLQQCGKHCVRSGNDKLVRCEEIITSRDSDKNILAAQRKPRAVRN